MKDPKIKRRDRRNWTLLFRRTVQVTFVVFIIVASVRHNLLEESGVTASTDALCPLGGLETLGSILLTGNFTPKTHPSNIVLGIGLLIGAILSGAAFCGWICPFGSLQDGLTWLRKKLHVREVYIPTTIDRWLRFGRFIVLGVILFETIHLVKLWFSAYDPYRTVFSLGWLFEFNLAEQWPAYLIVFLVLFASFFIPRAWCKYACPLGGVLSLVSNVSILRIRRDPDSCKNCSICNVPCPVGIAVSKAKPRVSTNCIGCLECVEACPRHDTLEVKLSPAWMDGIRTIAKRFRQTAPASGD
jgi:polyferredoxin